VSGNYAYVADDDSGLRVVSVADPAHPAEVGHYSGVRGAYDVVVVGDYAYVADNGNGLCIVSVVDPANPIEVGRYVGTGGALGVAVAGNYAYLAAGSSGLRVDSVTDPTHPVEVGYCDAMGSANDVKVIGDYAHIASWNGAGYSVISVADPAHPVEVGHYGVGNSSSVALCGGYAYVAGNSGVSVLQFYGAGVEESSKPQSVSVKPRPTIVRGVLLLPGDRGPGTGDRAALLDIAGRGVMRLKPGANDVSRLAPGVYFLREDPQVASLKLQAVQKVVVAK